jgi:hypothetical protein
VSVMKLCSIVLENYGVFVDVVVFGQASAVWHLPGIFARVKHSERLSGILWRLPQYFTVCHPSCTTILPGGG